MKPNQIEFFTKRASFVAQTFLSERELAEALRASMAIHAAQPWHSYVEHEAGGTTVFSLFEFGVIHVRTAIGRPGKGAELGEP
jgi:hypothetical protein